METQKKRYQVIFGRAVLGSAQLFGKS